LKCLSPLLFRLSDRTTGPKIGRKMLLRLHQFSEKERGKKFLSLNDQKKVEMKRTLNQKRPLLKAFKSETE